MKSSASTSSELSFEEAPCDEIVEEILAPMASRSAIVDSSVKCTLDRKTARSANTSVSVAPLAVAWSRAFFAFFVSFGLIVWHIDMRA